jgi:hypothetical protein
MPPKRRGNRLEGRRSVSGERESARSISWGEPPSRRYIWPNTPRRAEHIWAGRISAALSRGPGSPRR